MKIKNLFLFGLGALLAVTLASCSKSEGDPTPSGAKLLPSKIVVHSGSMNVRTQVTTYRIEYDAQNRFSRILESSYFVGIDNDPPVYATTFTYDANTVTATRAASLPFDPEPYHSAVTAYMRTGSQVVSEGKAPIRIDGQARAVGYNAPSGKYTDELTYTYDKKGNTASFSWNPWHDERIETYNLSYDDKNGVFRHVNMPGWYLTTQMAWIFNEIQYQNLVNNCIEATREGHVIYEYENTYNANGYPTAIARIPVGVIGSGYLSYEIEYTEAN